MSETINPDQQPESNQSGIGFATQANSGGSPQIQNLIDASLGRPTPSADTTNDAADQSSPVDVQLYPSIIYASYDFQNQNKYKIVWRGSPNFWSGRDGQTPVAICDHIMQGSLEASDGWFKNRRSDVSSHFGVGQDGRIWQWVKAEDTAWANGILQSPDTSLDWLAECVRRNINPNSRTISIEHEGYSGKAFPDAQYQATLWLHRYLCQNYNIQPDRHHIIGHYQITARDRAGCPGNTFPWDKLINDLGSAGAVVQPPVVTPPSNGTDWTQGVTGVVKMQFGPAAITSNNSFVRSRPSLTAGDGTLVRTLNKGTVLHFSGYTDVGPEFRGESRWYLITEADGGGWIHSLMIA